MQRFNCSHTYWWLCLRTWFGLSMSMWQAISLTLLTWTTLQCHLSKEMYNDYLQNIIITYFIKCHNMSKDWISLYANIIYISIFVIFGYDILCQHEFDGHPVHTVMQTRLVPLPAAIPSSDETGRYARISPVAILTGSVSLRASRMSAAGFGNTRPITPHHAR